MFKSSQTNQPTDLNKSKRPGHQCSYGMFIPVSLRNGNRRRGMKRTKMRSTQYLDDKQDFDAKALIPDEGPHPITSKKSNVIL